ncbi:MAG: calcium-binding protein [Clostridia bacterium]|nr:calcium-binding protein [Clostridia bacterium]
MQKKWIGMLLVICLMLPTRALALEGIYKDICPLNTSVGISVQDGKAQMHVSVLNTVDCAVSYFAFSVTLLAGKPQQTFLFRAAAEDIAVAPYQSASYLWSLEDYGEPVQYTAFRVDKIIFADGTVWTGEEPLYAAPYLYARNQRMENGKYVLDGDNGLRLVDYSYSSQTRRWYIWNEPSGWVYFSDALDPTCYVWQDTARIKLEINGTLSKEEVFPVVTSPGAMRIHFYATGETKDINASKTVLAEDPPIGSPHPYAAYTPAYTYEQVASVQMPYKVGDAPAVIAFWDLNETQEARSWYIYLEGAWRPFSNARGPICELWQKGMAYIKLCYGEREAVYAIWVDENHS